MQKHHRNQSFPCSRLVILLWLLICASCTKQKPFWGIPYSIISMLSSYNYFTSKLTLDDHLIWFLIFLILQPSVHKINQDGGWKINEIKDLGSHIKVLENVTSLSSSDGFHIEAWVSNILLQKYNWSILFDTWSLILNTATKVIYEKQQDQDRWGGSGISLLNIEITHHH